VVQVKRVIPQQMWVVVVEEQQVKMELDFPVLML
jgi:hypothetical protein